MCLSLSLRVQLQPQANAHAEQPHVHASRAREQQQAVAPAPLLGRYLISFHDHDQMLKRIPLTAWLLFLITAFFYIAILNFYQVASDMMQNTGKFISSDKAGLYMSVTLAAAAVATASQRTVSQRQQRAVCASSARVGKCPVASELLQLQSLALPSTRTHRARSASRIRLAHPLAPLLSLILILCTARAQGVAELYCHRRSGNTAHRLQLQGRAVPVCERVESVAARASVADCAAVLLTVSCLFSRVRPAPTMILWFCPPLAGSPLGGFIVDKFGRALNWICVACGTACAARDWGVTIVDTVFVCVRPSMLQSWN